MEKRDGYDDEEDKMSVSEIAKHFNESIPKETDKKLPDFNKMSKEEVEKWEKDELESNDIYRIAARVKNLARSGGASLTPVGEILCNTFVHMAKELYELADTLDEDTRQILREAIKKHEDMPAKVISASKSGVRVK